MSKEPPLEAEALLVPTFDSQGYCLYGECSPGYPVGHTCSSSNDCALPVGAASGAQPLQCSSGTCGGYGAYCPVNTQNSDSTTSWCSSGLACVNYQCALAASGTARKRKRLQQQMQKSLSRTWQQQQLDSTESCGDGSIRCPTGGAPGAFEVRPKSSFRASTIASFGT